MRNILNYFLIIALIAFASCKKAGDDYNLNEGIYSGNSLSATTYTLALTAATENDTAVRFNWSPAEFGYQPVVNYSLQVVRVSDTAANGWSNAKTFAAGANKYQFAFLVKEINSILNEMGLPVEVVTMIAVRIKADVNQSNGAASTIPSAYTNTATLNAVPYGLALYVPGDYQGWNPGAAKQLAPIPGRPGLYEGYVYMPGAGQHYFKYTNAPDWNHTNYGDGGNGTFSTDGLAGGLSVPDGGYYYLTANLGENKWTATKITWGVIGDASPGGWDNDTNMSYDAVSETWKVTANMVNAGSWKFRANNAWVLNFGLDSDGNLHYADNPFLGYTPNLANLTVPSNGNYTITLDLHIPGKYSYILQKN